MIHLLLSLTRPLFLVDTETTGVDPQKDRIVEIGFQQWGAEGMVKEWRALVNPGIPIPASATKVHGITDAVFKVCRVCGADKEHGDVKNIVQYGDGLLCDKFSPWPSFKDLAPNLAKGFTACDYAGKNVRFDLRLLAAEMARAGQAWGYAGARIIDADRLEQLAVPRDLGSLHEKYAGAKHDGAHGALSDVRASATVIAKQLEAHAALPRDLDALHAAQWPGWLCEDGAFRLVDGVATCQFGKWRGRAMRDIEASYWDWILKAEFPADVKALAAAAKLGKFPEGA